MHLWSSFTFYAFWIGLFVCVAFAGVYVFVLLLTLAGAILWWYHVPQLPEERVTCVIGPLNFTNDSEERTNRNSDEHCDRHSITAPIMVAHRGGAIDAPENTIEAFKLVSFRFISFYFCRTNIYTYLKTVKCIHTHVKYKHKQVKWVSKTHFSFLFLLPGDRDINYIKRVLLL